MQKPRARVWGFRAMLAGLVIGLFPLLLSALFSIGCENPFDESACSGAVVLWYLLVTLPLGFLVSIVGLVLWLVGSGRKPKA
jgi:cytochrome bd-type quinol oxidase subunit 1